MSHNTLDRRGFLKLGAAGAMAALGLQVAQAAWPAKSRSRWGSIRPLSLRDRTSV